MKCRINENICQGHNRCAVIAPDVFVSDENGYGKVISEVVPQEFWQQARDASMDCPEGAIEVEE